MCIPRLVSQLAVARYVSSATFSTTLEELKSICTRSAGKSNQVEDRNLDRRRRNRAAVKVSRSDKRETEGVAWFAV